MTSRKKTENPSVLGFKLGQEIDRLTCIDITDQGYGVVKHQGFTIFVKGLLKKEIANIKLVRIYKNYAIAIPMKISNHHESRVSSQCPYFYECGGCQYHHVSYQEELKIKNHFQNQRLGQKHEIIGVKEYNYRNKITLAIYQGQCALIAESGKPLPIDSCLIVHPKINEIIKHLNNLIPNYQLDQLQRVIIRVSDKNRQILITFSQKEQQEQLALLVKNLKKRIDYELVVVENIGHSKNYLFNQELEHKYIYKTVNNLNFRISSKSFFQVNDHILLKIIQDIKEHAALLKTDRIGDLYCGVGVLGASLASNVKEVIGFENNKQAVLAGNQSLEMNKINNMKIIEHDLNQGIKNFGLDTVIVDPPRKGLSKSLIKMIRNDVNKIIYLSCNPQTLKRDLQYLDNFNINFMRSYDMFPQTNHLETLVILTKNNPIS